MKPFISIVVVISLAIITMGAGQYVPTGFNKGASGGSSVTTVVQHKNSGATLCNGSSCAVTVSSTGSGNIIVAVASYNSSGSLTISSVTNGGTYTHCTNCHSTDANGNQVDASYTLSSSSGVTTITVNLSGAPSSGIFTASVYELSGTGTYSLDTSNSTTKATCTTCAGEALTLGGTNEGIVQIITPNATCSAIASPFSTNSDFPGSGDAGSAAAVSQSSGAAPNWTCTSGTAAVGALAFL